MGEFADVDHANGALETTRKGQRGALDCRPTGNANAGSGVGRQVARRAGLVRFQKAINTPLDQQELVAKRADAVGPTVAPGVGRVAS